MAVGRERGDYDRAMPRTTFIEIATAWLMADRPSGSVGVALPSREYTDHDGKVMTDREAAAWVVAVASALVEYVPHLWRSESSLP